MPEIQLSSFTIGRIFYTGIVFALLVPRFLLCPLVLRRRYQAVIGALIGIFLANFVILALLIPSNSVPAYAEALGGLLLSIWVTLLLCGMTKARSKKSDDDRECVGTDGS